MRMMKQFPLGDIGVTSGFVAKMGDPDRAALEVKIALARHQSGDWGQCCAFDKEINDEAVKTGGRVLSVYLTDDAVRFYVITDWDRAHTTVMLCDEY